MVFIGLPQDVAARRFDLVKPLQRMTPRQQNEFLGVMWHTVNTAHVTSRYRRDLGLITAAVKRTQCIAEAIGHV